MPRSDVAGLAVVVGLLLLVPACSKAEEAAPSAGPAPARLEEVDAERSRLVLTGRAVERLDLQTSPVVAHTVPASGEQRWSVPYAALLYTAAGRPWVYTAEGAHHYLRVAVALDAVEGDRAVLSVAPPVGTQVVTAGAAELFGTELDVGH